MHFYPLIKKHGGTYTYTSNNAQNGMHSKRLHFIFSCHFHGTRVTMAKLIVSYISIVQHLRGTQLALLVTHIFCVHTYILINFTNHWNNIKRIYQSFALNIRRRLLIS